MTNYRTENRIVAQVSGRATILGHPDVTVPCQIRDFSRSGLCIIVAQPIASGTIVKVDWSDNFLVGRAQSVSPTGGSYRVGLELLYCSKWSEETAPVLARA